MTRQRTRKEQHADAGLSTRDRARLLTLGLFLVLGVSLGLAAMAYLAGHPTLPPECATLYHKARTAADTARIDKLVFPKKATLSCGTVREALRRPA